MPWYLLVEYIQTIYTCFKENPLLLIRIGWQHFLLDWMPMASKPPPPNRKFFGYFPPSLASDVNRDKTGLLDKHRKNCECRPVSLLIVTKHSVLKGHKGFLCLCLCLIVAQIMSPHFFDQMSLRSQVSRIALWMEVFSKGICHCHALSFSLSLFLFLYFCWSCHVSSSLWSNVSKVTSLQGCSNVVFLLEMYLSHYWVSGLYCPVELPPDNV